MEAQITARYSNLQLHLSRELVGTSSGTFTPKNKEYGCRAVYFKILSTYKTVTGSLSILNF